MNDNVKTGNKKPAKQPKPANNKDSKNSGLRFEEQVDALRSDLEKSHMKAEEAHQKAEENWDKALRALSELENVKRRADEDVSRARKFALDRFVNELLPVIDSLEHALAVDIDSPDMQAMKEGVELTLKMFINVLQKFGVEVLDPVGEPFNPEIHEAISMLPSPDIKSNMIVNVVQRGYLLNGRVVRAAKVVVSQ